MICPLCGSEYRPGVSECADCRVPLVDRIARPEPEPARALDLVTVLETGDARLALAARGLLTDAGIPFLARNEQLQDLFGLGRLVPCNPVSGPVTFQVAAEQAEAARRALEDLLPVPEE